MGESKSEPVGPLSRVLLSADEWKNGLVVDRVRNGIVGWLSS